MARDGHSKSEGLTGQWLRAVAKRPAVQALVLRGVIVALHLSVLLLLAAGLGLERFGQLVVLWALVQVLATVLSLGAPLLLLRHASDGVGLHPVALLFHILLGPIAIAGLLALLLPLFWLGPSWGAILGCALCLHVLQCLASVMRGLGSVNLSMFLRDAAPHVALGLGALVSFGTMPKAMIGVAGLWLLGFAVLAALWCGWHPRRHLAINRNGARPAPGIGFWGTSLMGAALAQVDLVLGGALLSAEQIGLYALLRRLANLVALPVSVATWVSAGNIAASRDAKALQLASARGSAVALWPGIALFGAGLLALPFVPWMAGGMAGAQLCMIVLLCGALLQVIFASATTVATLRGAAHFAALTRAISLGGYGALMWLSTDPGAVENAIAYVAATGGGSAVLWVLVFQRFAIDSSAISLWRRSGVQWKAS